MAMVYTMWYYMGCIERRSLWELTSLINYLALQKWSSVCRAFATPPSGSHFLNMSCVSQSWTSLSLTSILPSH